MAQMYPEKINPQTKSRAERVLYDAFTEHLNNSYVVFHQVAWQSLDDQRRPRDGEADFVIAHPSDGVLVLEVKGGGISYNFLTSQWISTDNNGVFYEIKDPFEQSKKSKYVLLEQLKTMLKDPRRYINIGHAVAFPDVSVDSMSLGLDKPRGIILDVRNLTKLAEWVSGAMDYWRGSQSRKDTALNQDGENLHASVRAQEKS